MTDSRIATAKPKRKTKFIITSVKRPIGGCSITYVSWLEQGAIHIEIKRIGMSKWFIRR